MPKEYNIKPLVGILCILWLSSCERWQEQSLDPAWLQINQIKVLNNNSQVVNHQIRDVWVYIDDNYFGSFSLPFSLPVMEAGNKTVKLFPGIRYYGILSRPEIYTLLNQSEIKLEFTPQKNFNLQPVFTYKSNSIIYLEDGFEEASVFIHDLDSLPNGMLTRISTEFSTGKYSASGVLNIQNPLIETATAPINISQKNNVFLELDIRSEVEVNIGYISLPTNSKNYFLTLRPNSSWKKIYIPLFELISTDNSSAYQLAIRSKLPDGQNQVSFFIDNLRVLSLR